MEEKNKKKRKILIYSIISVLVIGTIGYSLARYMYDTGGDASHKLLVGDIYIKYNGQPELELPNLVPSHEEPNNYYQFTIEGVNPSPDTIVYDISVLRGDLMTGKTESQRIADKFLMFTLKRSTDGTNFTNVATRVSFSDLSNGARLYVDNIGTTNNKITYTYRLYGWVGDNVVITGGDATDGDYPDTEWKNMFATVKVRVTGDFQSKTTNRSLATYIKNQATEDYISQYSGLSNDTYNGVGNQTIYYFTGNTAKEHNNVLFAGYCWQIIRTTDTGGVKLLYNGVAENNQCLTTRNASGTMKGINGSGNAEITGLNTTTTYGTGFTYDESGFKLTGIMTNKTWSSNHEELIGTYTCKGNNISCTTISQIGRYMTNSTARGATYTIGNLEDKYTIGKTPFNGAWETLANVGYMYNKQYVWTKGAKTSSTYANDVTYSNGVYTLAGTTLSQDAPDNTHHYVCDNTNTTTCSIVRYYYSYYDNVYRYITLENGETIEDALYNMTNHKQGQTSDVNLNVHNSSMKAYLESWYAKNLIDYSSYIDTRATYCNDRKVKNTGGWGKNGVMTNWWTLLFIGNDATRTDLSCTSILDKFSVENNKAKLTYPIGLITDPERQLMSGAAGDGVENKYVWGSSPNVFLDVNAHVRLVSASGDSSGYSVGNAVGARPAVSLRPDASFTEGNGTYVSPYVVGEKINRTIS